MALEKASEALGRYFKFSDFCPGQTEALLSLIH